MFLGYAGEGACGSCFPRVRGDVPVALSDCSPVVEFSPRARGCSETKNTPLTSMNVFPACAGMFRLLSFLRLPLAVFSPRARGCSANQGAVIKGNTVFPTCAGMFPSAEYIARNPGCFPRVRGDVPWWRGLYSAIAVFSPRARGCSGGQGAHSRGDFVFPACAGMFR